MPNFPSISASRYGNRALRRAILASFSQSAAVATCCLATFREKDWRREYRWLDTSGLALYLLDHLAQLGCDEVLPACVRTRLAQNLTDNRARSRALAVEACAINQRLQSQSILFANVKGLTLTPESVPDSALRCQLDLDFLVCATDAERAERLLEAMGYHLECINGDTWEFKAGNDSVPSIADLYKVKAQRAVELHLTSSEELLERVVFRTICGITMPVLSPVHQFLSQATHLFEHLSSSFTRASCLLEFRRHMLARVDDADFWMQLEECSKGDTASRVALGVATLLVVEVFGDTPPCFLAQLVAGDVPTTAQLWVRLYGLTALLADFPGTKLYLLLQTEDETGLVPLLQHLLPRSRPRSIITGAVAAPFSMRARQGLEQWWFMLGRLSFHAIEGCIYLVEASRFRRLLAARRLP